MSTELIRHITYKKDGVYFTSCSNNVSPQHWYSERARWYSDCYLNEGNEAVLKAILWDFVTGSFRLNGNDPKIVLYQNVANKVKHSDKYEQFDNIYWCWDDINRTWEEKNIAKEQIQNMLYSEYLKQLNDSVLNKQSA